METIYLDNAATTRCYDSVIEKMTYIQKNCYANPMSLHSLGILAQRELEEARGKIASVLLCLNDEIFFTSGATEGNNMAILGACDAKRRAGSHIITSKIEHPSVENAVKRCVSNGFRVSHIDTKGGILDYDQLEGEICEDTVLLSFMLVNNELGSINDIKRIRQILKNKNSKAILHCDCVQGFGKIPCNIKEIPADIITISAHKIHGPKGVGAIYIKKGVKVNPILYGGGQEREFRPGTHNLPAIAGFKEACETCFGDFDGRKERLCRLKDYLTQKLNASGSVFKINTPEYSSPHILNISTPVKSEVMLHFLESRGIFISVGSACSSKNTSKSILSKAGFSKNDMLTAIRISFGDFNTKAEIDALVLALEDGVRELFPI